MAQQHGRTGNSPFCNTTQNLRLLLYQGSDEIPSPSRNSADVSVSGEILFALSPLELYGRRSIQGIEAPKTTTALSAFRRRRGSCFRSSRYNRWKRRVKPLTVNLLVVTLIRNLRAASANSSCWRQRRVANCLLNWYCEVHHSGTNDAASIPAQPVQGKPKKRGRGRCSGASGCVLAVPPDREPSRFATCTPAKASGITFWRPTVSWPLRTGTVRGPSF